MDPLDQHGDPPAHLTFESSPRQGLLHCQQGFISGLLGAFIDLMGQSEYHVLVDGRRINQPDLSGVDWLQIPLEQVERVEIVIDNSAAMWRALGQDQPRFVAVREALLQHVVGCQNGRSVMVDRLLPDRQNAINCRGPRRRRPRSARGTCA